MKQDFITVGGKTLLVHVPETREELVSGYSVLEPRGGEGMLFLVAGFATVPRWIPIIVGKDAAALDVIWCERGVVTAIAENQRGCLQGSGDVVLEVPAGWVRENRIRVGDRLALPGEGRGN